MSVLVINQTGDRVARSTRCNTNLTWNKYLRSPRLANLQRAYKLCPLALCIHELLFIIFSSSIPSPSPSSKNVFLVYGSVWIIAVYLAHIPWKLPVSIIRMPYNQLDVLLTTIRDRLFFFYSSSFEWYRSSLNYVRREEVEETHTWKTFEMDSHDRVC